jgi:hypothetical protein
MELRKVETVQDVDFAITVRDSVSVLQDIMETDANIRQFWGK